MTKTRSLAALALVLAATAAVATELPPLAVIPDDDQEPESWSGLHVGVNAGGAWSAGGAVNFVSAPVFVTPGHSEEPWSAASAGPGGRSLSAAAAGFVGGVQLGYDKEVFGRLVAGVEADFQGLASAAGRAQSFGLSPAPAAGVAVATALSATRSLDYLGTARARIGYLVTPTLQAYATGGLAYGGGSFGVGFAQAATNDAPYALGGLGLRSAAALRAGWTVGGGLEWMVFGNWSVKAEYLYYDLGRATLANGFATDVLGATLLMVNANSASTSLGGHLARLGVNYRIGW